MSVEKVVEKIKENSLTEALQISEDLRKKGVPIIEIRYAVYNLFCSYVYHNRKKAEEIARIFGEDYQFKYWLK